MSSKERTKRKLSEAVKTDDTKETEEETSSAAAAAAEPPAKKQRKKLPRRVLKSRNINQPLIDLFQRMIVNQKAFRINKRVQSYQNAIQVISKVETPITVKSDLKSMGLSEMAAKVVSDWLNAGPVTIVGHFGRRRKYNHTFQNNQGLFRDLDLIAQYEFERDQLKNVMRFRRGAVSIINLDFEVTLHSEFRNMPFINQMIGKCIFAWLQNDHHKIPRLERYRQEYGSVKNVRHCTRVLKDGDESKEEKKIVETDDHGGSEEEEEYDEDMPDGMDELDESDEKDMTIALSDLSISRSKNEALCSVLNEIGKYETFGNRDYSRAKEVFQCVKQISELAFTIDDDDHCDDLQGIIESNRVREWVKEWLDQKDTVQVLEEYREKYGSLDYIEYCFSHIDRPQKRIAKKLRQLVQTSTSQSSVSETSKVATASGAKDP